MNSTVDKLLRIREQGQPQRHYSGTERENVFVLRWSERWECSHRQLLWIVRHPSVMTGERDGIAIFRIYV